MTNSGMPIGMRSMKYCVEISTFLQDTPVSMIRLSEEERTNLGPEAVEVDEDAIADHRLMRVSVAHLLDSIVFEIGLKILWALEKGIPYRHTHDIKKLFGQLADSTRADVEELYDNALSSIRDLSGTDASGQPTRISDRVRFQTLREALQENQAIITKFKYDLEFRGKSSSLGSVIWNLDDGVVYALPPVRRGRFPRLFYDYVEQRVAELN